MSAATTSTCPAEPAVIESTAIFSAVVPARRTPVTSAVKISLRKSRAVAIMTAHCFSTYGGVVVAKRTPSIASRSMPFRHCLPAATAMVTLSSSKFAIALSTDEPQPSVSLPRRYRGM